MNPEIKTFFQIWFTAILSLIFARHIAGRLPTGAPRLLSLLPVFYLFTILPLRLSSPNLIAIAFYYLLWLGNFKLLLFAFGQPPLSMSPPLSLLHFVSIATLPINKTLTPKSHPNHRSPLLFLLKCLLFALLMKSYDYRESIESINPHLISALYCFHLYLAIEFILAISATPVRAVLGLDLEPQFNEPYLATSLQDFWSRRWNLMVPRILHPTVFQPVRRISERIVGRSWALVLAIIATFVVSGLMHAVLYYNLLRVPPTWDVMWHFVLHGFCLCAEIWVKKALTGRWRLHRVVSGGLTLGFVVATTSWLLFPHLIRNGLDLKIIDEYKNMGRYFAGGE